MMSSETYSVIVKMGSVTVQHKDTESGTETWTCLHVCIFYHFYQQSEISEKLITLTVVRILVTVYMCEYFINNVIKSY